MARHSLAYPTTLSATLRKQQACPTSASTEGGIIQPTCFFMEESARTSSRCYLVKGAASVILPCASLLLMASWRDPAPSRQGQPDAAQTCRAGG
eukprot:CAMPEP_0195116008 /NCGR_PEP_ID=MMETSP0448-20130528/110657_1 /TAXON_ID=66468 /ORGANISM="Heterocapsa triquestra, Strain CCMP 448" /LENGTH=93 /DNA_ID=CAMNT_0040153145 /DNA_START=84 /DNA_END=361 /DNA_ORIENTATION=+